MALWLGFTFCFNRSIIENSCLKLLKSHAKLCVEKGGRQHITVRRKSLWLDTKRAITNASFYPALQLYVTFVGEERVDAGGLIREYFQVLW